MQKQTRQTAWCCCVCRECWWLLMLQYNCPIKYSRTSILQIICQQHGTRLNTHILRAYCRQAHCTLLMMVLQLNRLIRLWNVCVKLGGIYGGLNAGWSSRLCGIGGRCVGSCLGVTSQSGWLPQFSSDRTLWYMARCLVVAKAIQTMLKRIRVLRVWLQALEEHPLAIKSLILVKFMKG